MRLNSKATYSLHIVIFLLITFFLTAGRVGTSFHNFALLTPDLGVYASFAVAQEHPELFVNDPLLSRPENINDYDLLYFPLVKALKSLLGNYGTASIALLPLCIFLHLLGFYLLGLAAFKSPWAALLISFLLSAPVILQSLPGYWGLTLDPMPRFMYQSLLPFVLAFVLHFGREMKWWPICMALLGLLTYVHPIGTPVWGLAVPLGLWISAREQKFWVKLRMLALAIFIFLIILAPFLFTYFAGTKLGANTGADYEQVMNIVRERFSQGALRPEIGLLNFFFKEGVEGAMGPLWYVFWLGGLAGLAIGLLRHPGDSACYVFRSLAGWIGGVLIGAAIIPLIEKKVFAYLRIFPPELELTRNLRYLVPLLLFTLCYALWAFREPLERFLLRGSALSPIWLKALASFLFLFWIGVGTMQKQEFVATLRQNLNCWLQIRLICPLPLEQTDFIRVLDVLQSRTPPGARVFSEEQEVAIRYYALRPLVFSYKDGSPLAYTDHVGLLSWNAQYAQMTELGRMRRFPFRRRGYLKGLVEFAQNAGAEYVILHEPYDPENYYPPKLTLLYTNSFYSLYTLSPP